MAGDTEAVRVGQVGFCTTALVTLCITGVADGVLDPTPPPNTPPTVGIVPTQAVSNVPLCQ